MIPTRYLFCLIAKAFGYRRKNVYMTEAAVETYLLRDGVLTKHVSRSVAEDPECRKACKEHWRLVDIMGALRKSILLNHKLADFG